MEGDGDGDFDHRRGADVVSWNHCLWFLGIAVLTDASGPGLRVGNRYHSDILTYSVHVIPTSIIDTECDDERYRQ